MSLDSMTALFFAMTALALIPSTSVLVVIANSIASGFKHGVMTAMGILCGDFCFIFLAVYGLSAIANSLASLFILVRYLGAAYLFWMGIKFWSIRTQSTKIIANDNQSYLSSFTSGLFLTLADFKAIFFYISFFPAFLDLKQITIFNLMTIMAIATISIGGVKVAYAYLAAKATLFLNNSKAIKITNRLAGTAMIAVALWLVGNSSL